MKATVHDTWDSGAPRTLRDGLGGVWRVVADDGTATLAVEEIDDYGGGPATLAVEDMPGRGPGLATWCADDTLDIVRVADRRYEVGNGDVWVAGPDGWEAE